ncbi:nucleotidyltransferase family protein [Sphaerochaeta sp. PS]|jgi:molybdenum cofactor cytidylyltransferase|uniref:nucleotidyltransferase family protein n=1 Tax=Sphaerochaeta sp. PS TaxID=3076336 RepID=UPI0028A4C748|nr:nucleotidyltransferase family protein [Sphaerochaeta sp. PS]MDT4760905.1 nucleotidyltransferase family protein [Sphaerochaeta sp. PS]
MQNILLAAGLGTRSGGEKLLLPYKGQALVAHAAQQSLKAGLFTIVVTGFRNEEVELALKEMACPNLVLVHNDNYTQGQGSSTLVGAKALRENEDFFISLADMPLIEAEHYHLLAKKFSSSDALRPIYQGQIGHPVLLRANFKALILAQPIPFTMQGLLQEFHVELCVVDDEAFVRDIDTIHAYAELLIHPRP